MGVKTILDVTVKDVEKRRYPTKHYVYVLEVRWSEGTTTVVFRRYSDFFEFQCQLLERFPVESGAKDPEARMIPFLPGKKLFGRSHIRTVAEKRREKIDLYCRTLVRLPPKVSENSFVLDFFEVRDTDLNKPSKLEDSGKQQGVQDISGPLILERYVAISDYDKQKKNECSLKAGQTVEVVDKNQNGWWFVNVDDFHEGWVPATYLEPLYGSEDPRSQKLDEEEVHITLNAYTAQHDDEISFEKGVLVEVFEKGFDGWWKIRYQEKEGMAPAAYLHKYIGSVGGVTTGAQVVSSVKEAVLSTSTNATSPPVSPRPSARPTSPKSNTTVRPAPSKPSSSIRPTSPKSSSNATTPTSPNPTASMSAKEILSASLALSSASVAASSARRSTTSSPPPPAMSVKSSLSPPPSTGVSAASSAIPAPSPSPKPAEAPERTKFAPTFHSQPMPFIDKEPIYAPTPRLKTFKKPPLKKRVPPPIASKPTSTSPTTTPTSEEVNFELDFPEPVYEIIPEPEEEIYLTIADFSAANAQDGLSFGPGEACTVITKNPTGWWFVELNGQEGWVPSSYLESKKKGSTPTPKSPIVPALPSREKLDRKLSAAKKNPSPPMKKRETPALNLPSKSPVKKSPPMKRSSLKRSNSSDSLLLDKPKRPVKHTHSPPSITRNTGWQPQPAKKPVLKTATSSRPTVSKPNTATRSPRPARSPRPNRRSNEETSRPTVSGPIAVKSSPSLQHISKTRSTTLATKTSAPALKIPSSNSRTTSFGSRPPPPKPSTAPGQSKPTASIGHRRGSSDGPRPNAARRYSNENMQQNGITKHKSELERKLQQRKTGTLHPATSSVTQPKKTSPPQRPKPPPPSGTLPGRGQGPPKRPEPPKIKRPPPPRPGKLPVNTASKRTIFVTIADYNAGSDGCLEFKEGEVVEVMEKSEDGWWFVKIGLKEGWVPSTFLEEKEDTPPEQRKPPKPNLPPPKPNTSGDSPPTTKDQLNSVPEAVVAPKPKPRPRPRKSAAPTAPSFFRAVSSYEAPVNDDSAIHLVKGRVYEVMDKNENGWWLIKDGDREGWAPGTYFDPV